MSVFTNPGSAAAENAAQYVAAVLELLADHDPIAVMRKTPDMLTHLLAELGPEQVTQAEAPGKWSVRDVLQHLADSEIVWGCRMRMVIAQDRPPLVGYDQDLWASRLDYAGADATQALDVFRVLRRANLEILQRLTPTDRQRVGVHAERGEQALEHMIRLQAGHDLLHINQLQRIRGVLSGEARS